MSENNNFEINYDQLGEKLDEISQKHDERRGKPIPRDQFRGLEGELYEKLSADLGGKWGGILTEEEQAEIKRIQEEYDKEHPQEYYE